ncbi:hypothetical protein [Streptomyces sp. NPDC018031]|uniref:hypothetical protein n=1 Tax=Streptomyces sp. NPDC018031 TaxID=3365033 RepID=UPI0037A2ACDF
MTTIGRVGRALITAVALFLAVFLAIDTAAANSPLLTGGTSRSAVGAGTALEAATHRAVPDAGLLHPGDENCEGRRVGRAPAGAPAAVGKPACVCDCDANFAAGTTSLTGPSIKHHSVPVSRSGELAIALQTFRC